MAFVTYTPTTNVWWDVVGTPLNIPSATGDAYTYDNQELSTVATNPSGYTQQGFKGKVLDNLAFLGKRGPVAGTRQVNGPALFNSSNWTPDYVGGSVAMYASQALGAVLTFALDANALPHNATLNSVALSITGSSSDVALPATMPTLQVFKVDNLGNKTQLGTTTTDASTPVGNFVVAHTLTVASIATVVDRTTYSYWLQLTAEAGANAHVLMFAQQPTVTYT